MHGPPTGPPPGPPTGPPGSGGLPPGSAALSSSPAASKARVEAMYNYATGPAMPAAFGGGGFDPRGAAAAGGAPGAPGMPGMPMMGGGGAPMGSGSAGSAAPMMPAVTLDDPRQCSRRFMQLSFSHVPSNSGLATQSGALLGGLVRPLAPDAEGRSELPVVSFGSAGVVRCRRCRTYINPFVAFLDGGHRWRCNVCGFANDVPPAYFGRLDAAGTREDLDRRPELARGEVEIVAPAEYMVRPPQPPVYVFVIDVSYHAVASGMLESAVAAIRESLEALGADERTKVGFVTFDSAVHFYNLNPKLSQPQALAVPDLDELFLPAPDFLLVDLAESRALVETLLGSLPGVYRASRDTETAAGPALSCAYRIMQHIGGKMCVFLASLPSAGEGRLKHRENPKLLGTDKERALLLPEGDGYKTRAVEFCRVQIGVDLFLFSPQYTDVATLATLPRYTAGDVFHYPGFTSAVDGPAFRSDLRRVLQQPTGLEAVMRIRCSRGLRCGSFQGNFFMRGSDLMAVPNVDSDSVFSFTLEHDGTVASLGPTSVIQSALLYTTLSGERRIRVHTVAIPSTALLQDLLTGVDVRVMTGLAARVAVEAAWASGVEAARQAVQRRCIDMVRACKGAQLGTQAPNPLPTNMQLLPLFSMALQKSPMLRGGSHVGSDLRAYLLHKAFAAPLEVLETMVYPRLMAVHMMPPEAGLPQSAPSEHTTGPRHVLLPPRLGLSQDMLRTDGVFLMDAGVEMFLWVGRATPPPVLDQLFGLHSMQGVDPAKLVFECRDAPLSKQLHAVVGALREGRPQCTRVTVVPEGDRAELRFRWHFVEDRANFPGGAVSYAEYMGLVARS